MPRVLYLGNFEPPHSTENEIASCFRAMGWEVIEAQEDAVGRWIEKKGLDDWMSQWLRPDLVLWTQTWGLPDASARAVLARCEAEGILTAALHLDLFWGLHSPKGHGGKPRHRMPSTDAFFACSYVFTPDGDHDNEWEEAGVNHYWLPPAIGCSSCWDGERDERWAGIDVAFVGSRSYHPEWPHRERLISELERRFGDRFAHVSGETLGSALRGKALHDLYASVPVIIGDSCWVGKKPPETRYWSDRVYEVWGRGGFLLMPKIAAMDEHMGHRMPWWEPWDDFSEMEETIRFWLGAALAREEQRNEIVVRVRSEHTFAHRIREALDIMGVDA